MRNAILDECAKEVAQAGQYALGDIADALLELRLETPPDDTSEE